MRLGESISFGFLDGTGVNATAIKAGTSVIELEVVSKERRAVVAKVSKSIDILQDVRLYLPRYVGQPNSCTPTAVLMPPATRYFFDSNLVVSSESSLVTLGEVKNQI